MHGGHVGVGLGRLPWPMAGANPCSLCRRRCPIRSGACLFDAARDDFQASLFIIGFAGPVGRRSRRLCGAGIGAISKIAVATANFDSFSCLGLQRLLQPAERFFPQTLVCSHSRYRHATKFVGSGERPSKLTKREPVFVSNPISIPVRNRSNVDERIARRFVIGKS